MVTIGNPYILPFKPSSFNCNEKTLVDIPLLYVSAKQAGFGHSIYFSHRRGFLFASDQTYDSEFPNNELSLGEILRLQENIIINFKKYKSFSLFSSFYLP